MAGDSNEQRLALQIFNSLQGLGCPLVDGLYLKEASSVQELLCSPSLHRADILSWICTCISPSLKDKFTNVKGAQKNDLTQELTQFGNEMMLCSPNDQDLIKGLAPPMQQLKFLEQLLVVLQADFVHCSRQSSSSGDDSLKNGDLLEELFCQDHFSDLEMLLNPSCNPWPAHIRDHLLRSKSANNRSNHNHNTSGGSITRSDKPSRFGNQGLTEAIALLNATQSALQELHKECAFLDSSSKGVLSPCALKLAISDMSQLMMAFGHVYHTDFKTYCQRAPPALRPDTGVFRSVHELLHTCNTELDALKQLRKTSTSLSQTVQELQTEQRFFFKGQKHTLPQQLEELKKRYAAFLSLHKS